MRPAHTEGVEGSSRLGGFARRLHGVGPLLGLVALCIGGTLLNPDFATFDNAMNVLTRTSFIGIISVGMTFVIISGGIDLSVGSMAALIAGSMIWIMNTLAHGMGGFTLAPLAIIAIGIVLALVLGGLFGLAHGLLVTKGRIEPFIVTLGTLGIFRAVLTWLADGGALTLDQYLNAPHLAPTPYSVGQRGAIDVHLARERLKRHVVVTLPYFNLAPYVLIKSDLVFTTTRLFADHYAKFLPLTVVPAPLDFPPMQYYQLWHERCHYSDEVRWLRHLVADATRSLIEAP